jgi:hypothetical protein
MYSKYAFIFLCLIIFGFNSIISFSEEYANKGNYIKHIYKREALTKLGVLSNSKTIISVKHIYRRIYLNNDVKINISVSNLNMDLNLTPIPATNELTLNLSSETSQKLFLEIYSLTGKILMKQQIDVQKGFNYYPINLCNIESGTYILALSNGILYKTSKFYIIK